MSVHEDVYRDPRRMQLVSWLVLGSLAALAVGAVTGLQPTMADALAGLIAVTAVLAVRPSNLVPILIGSMFLEVIAFGGVSIARLLAPLALFVVLLEMIRGVASLRLGLPFVAAAAYTTWAVASGLWTEDASRTVYMLGSLGVALVYMVAVAALINSERDLKRTLVVLAILSLLVGASSIGTYAGFGWGVAGAEEGRAEGGLSSPNYFAALQLVALPLIIVLAAEMKATWQRYFLYGSALVTLGSVLTTLSRGGLFALAVLLLAMILSPARAVFPSPRHKAAVALVLVAALGFFLSRPHLRSELTGRVSSLFAAQTSSEADPSGAGRTELWRAARHSIGEHPFLGIGYGVFYEKSPELLLETPGVRLEFVTVKQQEIEKKEVHSAYLGSAAELGVVGLALFVGVLVATGTTLRRTARRARSIGAPFVARVANGLLLSLLGWSLSAFFIEVETARPLWVIVGLSLALPRLLDQRTRAAITPLEPTKRRSAEHSKMQELLPSRT